MRKMVTALALFMPLSLMAQDPSYTHAEAGLSFLEPPSELGDSDIGVRARAWFALQNNLFLRGEISTHRFDDPEDSDSNTLSWDLAAVGLGFIIPVNQPMDLYAAADFLYEFGDSNSGGFRAEGGAKAIFAESWDTAAGLRFERIDSESYVQVFANTWYPVADRIRLGGELAIGDFNEVLLGGRYRF
ncbi:MAG: hypothetical protein WED00_00420 [Aquisalimonadaceae bacterium]